MHAKTLIAVCILLLAVTVMVAPLAAEAQQASKVHRVGVLIAGPRAPAPGPAWEAFQRGLRELGYVETLNLVLETRYSEGRIEQLPRLAAELVTINVDVIVTAGPGPVRAAKNATAKIPIIMMAGSSDPVGEGLVASLARPGGNITGLTFAVSPERFGKQLELLKEAVPHVSRVAVLWDLDIEQFHRTWAAPLNDAARRLNIDIQGPVQVREARDFEDAFTAMMRQRAQAVLVVAGGTAYVHRARIGELAARTALPTMAAFKEFPQAGGLMSYGPDLPAIYHRAASYVDKILKGAKPGHLPIEQPTKFELVINLKTAKALGLTIPQSVLARADQIIE